MRKLITICKSLIIGGLMFTGVMGSAQTISGTSGAYQFPQATDYGGFGRKPTNVNDTQIATDAKDSYDRWKSDFVTSTTCNGTNAFRVIFDYFPGTERGNEDRSVTVSEGIAYGMLLSAYAGDRELFDGLATYYKQFANQNGVMHFRIRNCGVTGQNGASDAELDVAMAYIIASFQWADNSVGYGQEASDLIRIIRDHEFEGSILRPGDAFGGFSITNPSYFSPAYYEVYKEFDQGNDPVSFWNSAINTGYDIIEAAEGTTSGNKNGLVPDWTNGNGASNQNGTGNVPEASQFEDQGRNFLFDAIRTPWRTAIDFLWHQRDEARDYCTRLTDWSIDVNGGGTESLGSGYTITGNSTNNSHSNTFVGCFAMAGMAASTSGSTSRHSEAEYQTYLNRAYADNESTQAGFGQYFNASFKVISQFVLLGNFYLPPPDECDAPSLGDNRSLCDGDVTLMAGITGVSYQWLLNGDEINNATNSTFTVSTPGDYSVITTENNTGCTRTDGVTVGAADIEADFTAVPGPGSIILTSLSTGGISDFNWTVTDPNDGEETLDTEDAVATASLEGAYTVELEVSNECNDTDTKVVQVLTGDNGLAIDDFNNLFDIGIINFQFTFEDDPAAFELAERVFCSAEDAATAGASRDCDNFECSYINVNAVGATVPWASFVIDWNNPDISGAFGPIDLTSAPFVSIRASASNPVQMQVILRNADEEEVGVLNVDLTTTETTTVLDFTSVADDLGDASRIELRPYANDQDYVGNIRINHIIVGAASIPAPVFDIVLDEDGFTDFSNYLPDFFPNDTTLSECTRTDDSGLCFGSVANFPLDLTLCETVVTQQANSCIADEVRWLDESGSLVETGDEFDITEAGTYTVQLINDGGITERTFDVTNANLEADFTFTRENFQVSFLSQSVGATSLSWDFGDPDSDFNTATGEVTEHFFAEAGMYEVVLTAENSICDTEEMVSETITIECDQPASEILFDGDEITSIEGCPGDEVTISILRSDFASNYLILYPGSTELAEGPDAITATFELTSSSNLGISAFTNCGTETPLLIPVTVNTPTSAFSVVEQDDNVIEVSPALSGNDDATFAWSYGDGETSTEDAHTYTYPVEDADYMLCLTATNDCGTAEEICEEIEVVITGLENQLENGSLAIFPTVSSENLTITLDGEANVIISDLIGNTMKTANISNTGTVNVSELATGAYLITLEVNGETITKRFIKE